MMCGVGSSHRSERSLATVPVIIVWLPGYNSSRGNPSVRRCRPTDNRRMFYRATHTLVGGVPFPLFNHCSPSMNIFSGIRYAVGTIVFIRTVCMCVTDEDTQRETEAGYFGLSPNRKRKEQEYNLMQSDDRDNV